MRQTYKLSALTVALASTFSTMGFAEDNDAKEVIYTLSNNATSNEVLAFQRHGNGKLKPAGHFATGGTGTGAGLGNQGALALSDNERYLFAVNPGSNDVTVFRVNRDGLNVVDRAQEDGVRPVSITVNHNRVYVVNAGDDSIFGFQFDPRIGKLTALPQSHQKLSGSGTGAAQISFNDDGDALVVTEKATNKITTFTLNEAGSPTLGDIVDSAGQTPFGFAFGKRDQFFVSNAAGSAASQGLGTVSSYELEDDGSVKVIDDNVFTGQAASCWLATTPNGRFAFTAATPSNAISSFSINRDGHVTLNQSLAATENRPTDLAISQDGHILYALSNGDHTIGVYNIKRDGKLSKREAITALPVGLTGLVVR